MINNTLKIVITTLLCLSAKSYASECRLESGTIAENLNTGNIVVQRDAPVGSVLYRKVIPATHKTMGTCSQGLFIGQEKLVNLSHLPGNTDLFESGVPGVGIRLRSGPTLLDKTTRSVNNGPEELKDDQIMVFSLIKTGPIQPGPLTARTLYQASYSGSDKNPVTTKEIVLTGGTILQASCQVKTPNIVVPMGKVDERAFTGLNSTAGKKDFRIDLNCSKDTQVGITFSPLIKSKGQENSQQGIITPEITRAAAEGVSVQMLKDGDPVGFNVLQSVGKSTEEGEFSIPLQARYIQTEEKISPGEVNAIVSFTMTYQ